ncbi:MAG TPA: regulatory iron-sulfur-containing complex subunit RicT [Defluviitoga sp.]|nr:regulatory iron-sulfur-containing complex subunit RicT [Defluviitoga sp.]HOP23959.1 regulatory iron-sulfur-containing complex subunit RicT [Defluviitoga sp.]HPZ28894.1 regulatory iron-sulfur-containing complex subunit RicT [Defluviitoga sp.]
MIDLEAQVYGVEVEKLGDIYYCTSLDLEKIDVMDYVLVQTENGIEVGRVVLGARMMKFEDLGYEPKAILRKLTDEDKEIWHQNIEKAKEVTEYASQVAKELELKMRILESRFTFDGSKLIIFFGADIRIDFRELVKILAKKYKVRIELKQVGIRDEVKKIGSLGLCGQVACCCRFLRDFSSIKMELAKTQQMMINTAKISGRCGKLICCLKYENDFYQEVLKNVPNENSIIEYDGVPAKVVTVNVFLKEVTLQVIEENQPILIKVPFSYFNNFPVKKVGKESESRYEEYDEDFIFDDDLES